jgi:two-component system sensor histidine kinase MprB
MSLRLRLTFLCVALVAVVIAGFAVTTYFIARHRIYSGFDDGLTAESGAILSLLPPGTLSESSVQQRRSVLDNQAAAGLLFQIRTNDGNVLYSSFRGSPELLPRGNSLDKQTFFETNVAQQRLRLLYLPVDTPDHNGGSMEVGRSTSETSEALAEIRYALAAGSVLALFLTFVPAYYIAGRALRPIRDVSRLARRIERTGDFSQRLEDRKTSDETGELIATFNEMIERVDQTLVAQTEFLADSSHEMRRPLTILRTNLDILRDPGLPAADRAACLARMSREAHAMSSLVGDLLLLTRDKTQSLQRVHVDFSRLCADEVSRIGFAEGQVPIEPDIEPGLVMIGDEERLRQVVKNLLENAVKYTQKDGHVRVRLHGDDDNVRLEVQDTGIGIVEAELARIFDRFYRGTEARAMHAEGVGLGLAIVKYVVEGHGGSISASASPGCGAMFAVVLPRAPVVSEPLTDLLAVS